MLPEADVLPAPPYPADVSSVALFLDMDGSLIDFADRPSLALAPPELPGLLASLRSALHGALAPVSGRPLHEVDALLHLRDGAAAGLHGAELRHADGRVELEELAALHGDALRSWAASIGDRFPGLFIEHKSNSLALHYRDLPLQSDALREAAEAFASSLGDLFELQPGNHVLEIKPRGATKGSAIEALMREAPFSGRTPWMVGDDFTDEFGFERAIALGGNAIIIGARRPTLARFALPDPQSLRDWLAGFARRLEG